jgi:acylpyruvate hydrolase
MKIVTFTNQEAMLETRGPRPGALLGAGEQILDFERTIRDAGMRPPANVLDWFNLEGPWLQRALAAYKEIAGDQPYSLGRVNGDAFVKRAEVRLLAPVPRPGKLIGIGLNYRDHAAEAHMPLPERPMIFSKFTTSIVGPEDPVVLPPTSSQVDYEAELAVVLGRRARNVTAARASDYVLGYTIINDVTARDFQFSDGQYQRGKSCDTFAPMGPSIVTADEIHDVHGLPIRFRLNGNTLQDSNTGQLIFRVPELIAFLSETITLEPGDVIATGTPAGVGFARQPPVFLKPGDVMEVEIESLGILRNVIVGAAEEVSAEAVHSKGEGRLGKAVSRPAGPTSR